MEQPKLVLEGLSKKYEQGTALEPISLQIAAGEFLTLLGPSGSGKSTLLQMICGLVQPNSGRVLVDGRDETTTPAHQRDIGLVFQHYALFPHLTAAENIEFPLRMRAWAAADIKARVKDALAVVEMDQFAERFPRELSGGQQQRVALARSFVYQPSIILMDEPLGALDKRLREHMQIKIKQMHRESGATIIYVTHDQEEALALSDRICLINHESRVEQLGTPHEIYARPLTAFAAEFIGISNVFRGRLQNGPDGELRLQSPHGDFRLPRSTTSARGEGALVVRPEQLALGRHGENRISARVIERVYAGSETRLIASLDRDRIVVRLPPGHALPALGEQVVMSWDPDAAVLVP